MAFELPPPSLQSLARLVLHPRRQRTHTPRLLGPLHHLPPPQLADTTPPTHSEFDDFCCELGDSLQQHRSHVAGIQEDFEQAHKRSWRGLVADLDKKYAAFDTDLAALKAKSTNMLGCLLDHQTILTQHQTAINMLTEHDLYHDKRLSDIEKLLLHHDSLLQGHCTKTDESIASLCANVNNTGAKLTQDLPEIRRELQTTAQGLAMAIRKLDTTVQTVLNRAGMASAPDKAGACTNTSSDDTSVQTVPNHASMASAPDKGGAHSKMSSVPRVANPSDDVPDDPTTTPTPTRAICFPMADGFRPCFRSTSFPSGNQSPPVVCPPQNYRVDLSTNPPILGGPVESPRPSDKERLACLRQVGLFDIRGLATPKYHGGNLGVRVLMVQFIHECGYRSFSNTMSPEDIFLSIVFELECRDGLYYCPTDVFMLGKCPSTSRLAAADLHHPLRIPLPKVHQTITSPTPPILRRSSRFEPTSKARQLESEVWLLCLGSPGVRQLDVFPQNATGLPTVFEYHPF